MKEILSSCSDLLHNRNIDQLIICAIFANCKADKNEILFNDIRKEYEESNPNLKPIIPDILCNIYISDRDPPKDIIKFYNECFIKTEEIKNFIISLRQSNQSRPSKNNSKKNLVNMEKEEVVRDLVKDMKKDLKKRKSL